MSDLQAKLAALPPEPPMPYVMASDRDWLNYYDAKMLRDARLIALAAEWIESAGHTRDCSYYRGGYYSTVGNRAWLNGPCTCDRAKLIKELAVLLLNTTQNTTRSRKGSTTRTRSKR